MRTRLSPEPTIRVRGLRLGVILAVAFAGSLSGWVPQARGSGGGAAPGAPAPIEPETFTKQQWKLEFPDPPPAAERYLPPGGAFGLEDLPERNQDPGNQVVRAVRHAAAQLHGALRQLMFAVVEDDEPGIGRARSDVAALLEVDRESAPSDILAERLQETRARLADPKRGDPAVAIFRLQLDVERFRHLYPLLDLEGMTASLKRLESEGKRETCLGALTTLQAAVALPDLDSPLQTAQAAVAAAMSAVDARQEGEARRRLKEALAAVELLADGTYLLESEWYVAKAALSLEEGSTNIAAADLRQARALLETAAAGPRSPRTDVLASLLGESARLAGAAARPGAVTTAELRAFIERIQGAF